LEDGNYINAKDKNVIVIGGGDTGSDCVGTSIRQGAKSVTQIEILPQPPLTRTVDNPWPEWPKILRTSSSHEEGCRREFSVLTESFKGKKKLESIKCVRVEWSNSIDGQPPTMKKVAGSEFELKTDLVLLAMGFIHPIHDGLLKQLGVDYDSRGNVKQNNFKSSVDRVFTAGDMAHGQSLVLTAINSGRAMAKALDTEIKGFSHLS
jgi:glutamate synthase (NADPH/NADH) small chain